MRLRSMIVVGVVVAILPMTVSGPAAPAVVPVGVSLGNVSVVEGDTGYNHRAVVSVTLTDPATSVVSVPFQVEVSTTASAATPGVDFVRRSGTLTFKPAAKTGLTPTTKFVAVQVRNDTLVEGEESFVVTLGTPTGGTIVGPSSRTSTILDQDPSAPATISVGDATVWEGNSGKDRIAKVSLSLSEPLAAPATVQVVLGGETAAGGSDYRSFGKLVKLRAGTRDKSVVVKIIADTSPEPDEALSVELFQPSAGLTLGRTRGHVYILNDD